MVVPFSSIQVKYKKPQRRSVYSTSFDTNCILGGPGGSAVNLVYTQGKRIQELISSLPNSSEGLFFDIIGFDPRGVNNTTPSANCFPDDFALGRWAQQARAQGVPFSNESFANSWSRHVSLGESCSWRLGNEDDANVLGIGRFMGTPSVVEDMLAIVEALGEWRQKEAKKLVDKNKEHLSESVRERTKWRPGAEKLLYWGFSYGTLLGATFAAMHPDRVERVVLDGVVDADDYYASKIERVSLHQVYIR
jgi:pimeloyl-ACP methyl ester carboxylesterase